MPQVFEGGVERYGASGWTWGWTVLRLDAFLI